MRKQKKHLHKNFDYDLDDFSVKERTRHRQEKRLKRALQKRDVEELEEWDN